MPRGVPADSAPCSRCGKRCRAGRRCWTCVSKERRKAMYAAEKASRAVHLGPVEVRPGVWSVPCCLCLQPVELPWRPARQKVCESCAYPRDPVISETRVVRREFRAGAANLEG
jgi:hypothetical protein